MLTGFVVIDNNGGQSAVRSTADNDIMIFKGADEPYAGIEGRTLVDGLYYFSEDGGSGEGQMQTGRVAVNQDGETSYYYFEKNSKANDYGRAYTNAIKDGYLYGKDGKCVVAEDNNSYEVCRIEEKTIRIRDGVKDDEIKYVELPEKMEDLYVVVSKTGKVKKNGTVTIDGVKYTIGGDNCPYAVSRTEVLD